MYGIMPLWLAAGLADYLCPWPREIERSTGLKDSLRHSAHLSVVGIPALSRLFLDPRPVLAFTLVTLLLHEALASGTCVRQLSREIDPLEHISRL